MKPFILAALYFIGTLLLETSVGTEAGVGDRLVAGGTGVILYACVVDLASYVTRV